MITPTDIGVRNPELCMAVVEVAEAKQAIQTYEADVVIACWMVRGVCSFFFLFPHFWPLPLGCNKLK